VHLDILGSFLKANSKILSTPVFHSCKSILNNTGTSAKRPSTKAIHSHTASALLAACIQGNANHYQNLALALLMASTWKAHPLTKVSSRVQPAVYNVHLYSCARTWLSMGQRSGCVGGVMRAPPPPSALHFLIGWGSQTHWTGRIPPTSGSLQKKGPAVKRPLSTTPGLTRPTL